MLTLYSYRYFKSFDWFIEHVFKFESSINLACAHVIIPCRDEGIVHGYVQIFTSALFFIHSDQMHVIDFTIDLS